MNSKTKFMERVFNSLRLLLFSLFLILQSNQLRAKTFSQFLYETDTQKTCRDTDTKEIQTLEKCSASLSPLLSNQTQLNELSERFIIEQIARHELAQQNCTAMQLGSLLRNKDDLKLALDSTCEQLHFKDAQGKDLQGELNDLESYSYAVNHMREVQSTPNPMELFTDVQIKQASDGLGKSSSLVAASQSTDLLLSSPTVFDFVKRSLLAGLSADSVCQNLRAKAADMLSAEKTSIDESRLTLSRKIKTPDWTHDSEFVRTIWNSGSRSVVVREDLNLVASKDSSVCRLEGKYGYGAELRDWTIQKGVFALSVMSFGFGSVVAGGAEAPMLISLVARATVLATSTVDLVGIANNLQKSCGETSISTTSSANQCGATGAQLSMQIASRAKFRSCTKAVILGAAEGALALTGARLSLLPKSLTLPPARLAQEVLQGASEANVLSASRWFSRYSQGSEIVVKFKDGTSIEGQILKDGQTSFEMRTLEGNKISIDKNDPNFLKYELSDQDLAANRKFLRDEKGWTSARPNYLNNINAAQKASRADLDEFGRRTSQDTFYEQLRSRQTMISGRDSGTAYSVNGYDSDDPDVVAPGKFRDEFKGSTAVESEIYTTGLGKLIDGLLPRVKHLGIRLQPEPEILGLKDAAEKAKAAGKITEDVEVQPFNMGNLHRYPDKESLFIWRNLIFERYKEATEVVNAAHSCIGHCSPEQIFAALSKISDYYHTAINSHLFPRINNSLFMTDVNSMLNKIGLQEVPHGYLDNYAFGLGYQDFRRVFATFIRDRSY